MEQIDHFDSMLVMWLMLLKFWDQVVRLVLVGYMDPGHILLDFLVILLVANCCCCLLWLLYCYLLLFRLLSIKSKEEAETLWSRQRTYCFGEVLTRI